jgi:DNA-binding NtrC family response regulator
VQDRQYTPVGGNKPRELDVRVIAATHRDLAKDVDAGRFREDLFHRLNVVRLVVPPLRERPDDIVHLMQYFLEQYTEQHGKQAMQFTQDALEAGLRHGWPGNVRELQNRVMRAVVFCPGDRIQASDLEIEAGSAGNAASARPYPPPSSPAAVSPSPGPGTSAPAAPPEAEPPVVDPWHDLLGDLERRIDVALSRGVDHPPPLARWVADDFVLEAYRAAGETSCRAAEILGIPETTYRRRRGKILAQSVSGEPERPEQWGAVRERVRQIVSGRGGDGRDLLSDLRDAVLRVVSSKPVGSDQVGSAFMGVTPPTYRRWLSALRDAGVEESGVAG